MKKNVWKLQLLSLKQIVNSSGWLQPRTMIWAARPSQVAVVTPRPFRGKSLSKREEKVTKPTGRDAELAFGEQHAPKWEAQKMFGLEGHATPNAKAQRVILGNSH